MAKNGKDDGPGENLPDDGALGEGRLMARRVDIVVPGAPVPKGRPRFFRAGPGVRTYTPQKTQDYERRVKAAAGRAMAAQGDERPFQGPLSLRIMVGVAVPKSWSKRKRLSALQGETLPTTRPDLDNFAKAILDGLQDVLFREDSQITDLILTKRYEAEPRATVTAAEIETLAERRAA